MKDINVFFTGVAKNGYATSRMTDKAKYDLILGYNQEFNLFIAWNGFLHSKNEIVTINKKGIKSYDSISYVYNIYNDDRCLKEKKFLIPEQHIGDFCHRFIDYLMPNENDEGFQDSKWIWKDTEVIINSQNCKKERKRIMHETYERDPSFRKKVLENYGNQCAVCRTNIISILEAAHIDAVSKGGDDSLGNGICLCCNHHKLFDSDLLYFNNDYTYYSEILSDNEFFIEVFEKYNGKLVEPKVRGKIILRQ